MRDFCPRIYLPESGFRVVATARIVHVHVRVVGLTTGQPRIGVHVDLLIVIVIILVCRHDSHEFGWIVSQFVCLCVC